MNCNAVSTLTSQTSTTNSNAILMMNIQCTRSLRQCGHCLKHAHALTECLSQWLQSLSYEATDRLTALEHNNVPWMARPVIRPHIGQSWCDSTSGQLTPRRTLRDQQCVQDEGNRTTTWFSIAHIKEPNTTHYTAFENKAIRGASAFGVHSLG